MIQPLDHVIWLGLAPGAATHPDLFESDRHSGDRPRTPRSAEIVDPNNADPSHSRPFAAVAERLCVSHTWYRQPAASAGLGTGTADERQALRARTGARADRRLGILTHADADRCCRQTAMAARAEDRHRSGPTARRRSRRGAAGNSACPLACPQRTVGDP